MTITEEIEAKVVLRNRIEIANKMLREGLDKDLVVKITELEMAKVEQLSDELAIK